MPRVISLLLCWCSSQLLQITGHWAVVRTELFQIIDYWAVARTMLLKSIIQWPPVSLSSSTERRCYFALLRTAQLKVDSQYAWVSVAWLPVLCCNQKCIQNDLDACHNALRRLNRNYFYSSVAVRPNHFVCTFSCNATQAITLCSLEHVVNPPLVVQANKWADSILHTNQWSPMNHMTVWLSCLCPSLLVDVPTQPPVASKERETDAKCVL